MVATLYLLSFALAPAQMPTTKGRPTAPVAARGQDWQVAPRLAKAQELVYRGTFAEESRSGGVHFNRSYRVETRVFVLDAPVRAADVVLLTMVKPRDAKPGDQPVVAAVGLERAQMEADGRVVGSNLMIPLEGPPRIESGMFVQIPTGRISQGQGWDTTEVGRPPRVWRVVGGELVNGTSCVKLVSVQQSEDWDQPRNDTTAWRREDQVWLSPRTGIATRVERNIDRREPGRRDPNQRAVLRYELESILQYPGQLFEDRKQEALQAQGFSQAARPLLTSPKGNGPQLQALLAKINYHLDKETPTPYREAVLQVKRNVEAAQRGETPVILTGSSRAAAVADLGQPAPDFVVSYLTHSGPSFHLHQWLGRPIVLIFYNPSSPTGADLLRFAQKLATDNDGKMAVFGLAVAGDSNQVRKQWGDLRLTFPVLNGSGLRTSYAVETTPKVVLLDGSGVVRGAYLGWGSETPREVMAELRQWLPRK